MPRRYYDYMPKFEIFHQISSIGAYIMAVGFLLMGAYLLHSLLKGKKASANPWGGRTLEWTATTSPPSLHNFHYIPVIIHHPYDFHRPEADFQLGLENGHGNGHPHGGAEVELGDGEVETTTEKT